LASTLVVDQADAIPAEPRKVDETVAVEVPEMEARGREGGGSQQMRRLESVLSVAVEDEQVTLDRDHGRIERAIVVDVDETERLRTGQARAVEFWRQERAVAVPEKNGQRVRGAGGD